MKLLPAVITALLTISVVACDMFAPTQPERDNYVVRMFLTAGEPMPPLILSTVSPFENEVRAEGVPRAQVVLERLDEQGATTKRWLYERRNIFNEDSTRLLGTHGPNRELQQLRLIQPLTSYRLIVQIAETGEEITATTIVPDTFHIAQASSDALVYRNDQQLVLKLTRSDYPGRDAYYIVSSASTKSVLTRDDFTSGAAQLYQNVESPEELERLRRGSSPVLNEEGYEITADGFRAVRVPWISFRFFGPNDITIHALDDNLYDFVRSQQVQQGGSTLAPGETPNVIDRIEGGTGIFGSMSEAVHSFELLRPPD